MRVTVRSLLIVLVLAFAGTGCGSPPAAEVDAARAAVDKAAADRGDEYAAESLRAAQDARSALDAELKATGSQDNGQVLRQDQGARRRGEGAGDRAAADAVAGREKAEAAAAAAAKAKAAAAARAKVVAPIRIGGKIHPPLKIKDVQPVYPAIAQSARVAGAVVIEATIGEDGKVLDAKVVRSIPLLDQAALDAVRQWEYRPTLLNGVPVPVLINITVNFAR